MALSFKRRLAQAGLLTIAAGLMACAATPTPASPELQAGEIEPPVLATAPSAPTPSAPNPRFEFTPSGRVDFDAWRSDFAIRAVASGRDAAIVFSVLDGVKPLEIYLPSDPAKQESQNAISQQAEFAKPIWEYVATAVSAQRRANGTRKYAERAALFAAIADRFGVDGEAVAAIWGLETSFGGYIGDFDGPETLANMAVEGRRRGFAESELLATMDILARGDARRGDLIAGWAGAMGQTQFMPSVYLSRAVDWNGDGRKNIWTDEGDALASAANYLAKAGYRKDEPWGLEVRLPEGFNYALADGTQRAVADWRGLGLIAVDVARFGAVDDQLARLWLPAGAEGPAYLLLPNFDVFLAYNRASAYAFSAGLLADAIAGRPGPQTPWPTHIAPLSVAEIKTLQASLNQLGYNAGPVDGIAGQGTRRALQQFQVSIGLIADGYPTREVLTYVRGAEASSAALAVR